jgi:hypothetical protein
VGLGVAVAGRDGVGGCGRERDAVHDGSRIPVTIPSATTVEGKELFYRYVAWEVHGSGGALIPNVPQHHAERCVSVSVWPVKYVPDSI